MNEGLATKEKSKKKQTEQKANTTFDQQLEVRVIKMSMIDRGY